MLDIKAFVMYLILDHSKVCSVSLVAISVLYLFYLRVLSSKLTVSALKLTDGPSVKCAGLIIVYILTEKTKLPTR